MSTAMALVCCLGGAAIYLGVVIGLAIAAERAER